MASWLELPGVVAVNRGRLAKDLIVAGAEPVTDGTGDEDGFGPA
jgi:hypothetical protein